METCIIFVPDNLELSLKGYLLGFLESTNHYQVFYIYDKFVCDLDVNIVSSDSIIGSFCTKTNTSSPRKNNWITLKQTIKGVELEEVIYNDVSFNLNRCRYVSYNINSFRQSELLLQTNFDIQKENDYFKKLAHYIKISYLPKIKETSNTERSCLSIITFLMYFLSFTVSALDKVQLILRFSTFGLHFKAYVKHLLWTLDSLKTDGKINLQTGNFLLATIFDMIIGAIALRVLTGTIEQREIFNIISSCAQDIIQSIIILVEWLMGSPAGLKLNHPLNQIIGGFFLYNINLWWTFLGVVGPVLKYGFFVLLNLGFLGFTFQVAIIADLFILVTFHVYCIYVYAARLYELQIQGLWSLSKLVIGKKRNPVPGRIDSCPYTTEQLFIGTISFTVLLFLSPTVFVYYVVFVIMRLGVVCLCGIMTNTRYYIQVLPLYSTLIWLFRPCKTAMTVELLPVKTNGLIKWNAQAVSKSWWETVKACVPSDIEQPPPVDWKEILRNISTGKLIYPV